MNIGLLKSEVPFIVLYMKKGRFYISAGRCLDSHHDSEFSRVFSISCLLTISWNFLNWFGSDVAIDHTKMKF